MTASELVDLVERADSYDLVASLLAELRADCARWIERSETLFGATPTERLKLSILWDRAARREHDRLAAEFERWVPGTRIRRTTDPRPLPP